MKTERPFYKRAVDSLAEVSKKIDYVVIAVGAGIYVLWNQAVGGVLMVGSALTWFGADEIQKKAK